jgi:glycosyltransferase involved in cell wall biosynthesis
LRALGIPSTIVSWRDHAAVRDAIQTHSCVIFYRVPGYPEVLAAIDEAKRLGVTTVWEVDELIFDAEAIEANSNLASDIKAGMLYGVPLYCAALARCDHTMAATQVLADALQSAGAKSASLLENALDAVLVRRAQALGASPPGEREGVTIVYASGSNAHDADFRCAAEGLLRVMRARPQVRLRTIGEVKLPETFHDFGDRIQHVPALEFERYLDELASGDINLVPLEPGLFNDAKSNIRFLEAAGLGIPSVCSPRAAFREIIRSGDNGYMADTPCEWEAVLLGLVDGPERRREIGSAALATALKGYQPEAIGRRQLAPVALTLLPARKPALRVLVANTFYWPQMFGGATIVAEGSVSELAKDRDIEVAVFTSYGDEAPPYASFRYESEGVPVFAVKVPDGAARELEYVNPRMGDVFSEVLEAVRPDVVHLHAIQWLSASLAEVCAAEGIPYIVTLHDAWWLCERQFMMTGAGRHCGQSEVDLAVCAGCVPDSRFNRRRAWQLRRTLEGAARLLAPSEFQRRLYIANGFSPEKIVVNRNGIHAPGEQWPRSTDPTTLRFAFVGGEGPIKGIDLVRAAFENIALSNYELKLVDNTLLLGFSSVAADNWNVRGKLSVVPPYDRRSIDAFFADVDVLLFPSQADESFGLTVREALARDVWVIATDCGGPGEDIVDGRNGTIIPRVPDHGPLQRAITSLLENPKLLDGHINPYKARIATFATQASELRSLLARTADHPIDHKAGDALRGTV